LLGSRMAWAIAVAMGVLGAGIIGTTYVRTAHALEAAEKKIEEAAKNTAKIEEDDGDEKGEGKPEGKGESHEAKPGEGHEAKPGEAKPGEAKPGEGHEATPPKAEQKPGEPTPGSGAGKGDGKGPGGATGGGEHHK